MKYQKNDKLSRLYTKSNKFRTKNLVEINDDF